MKKTIIIGNFEYLNRKAVIHSIEEVYQANTQEELEALLDTFDNEGKDWLVLERTIFTLEITTKGLLDFIWGSKNPSITNNVTN
jgi:hypothetical protein